MKRNKVDIKTFYEMKEIQGKEQVKALHFDNRTGKEETIPVDAIVINIGFVINLDFLKSWGLKMEGNAITVNENDGDECAWHLCCRRHRRTSGQTKADRHRSGRSRYRGQFCCHLHQSVGKTFPGHSSNLNLSI